MTLNEKIIACERCPRLRQWCHSIAAEKKAAHREDTYWGLPVPNFGDPEAELLIIGLAPAAHGANRTGRMFTGDRSGDWLYRALHRAGAANQPTSVLAQDGLELKNVMITTIAHCAPPDNKPTLDEIANCRSHLEELLASRKWKAFLCLGSIAWTHLHRALGEREKQKFAHGAISEVNGIQVYGSYHPSQQNTFTGRLTEPMLDSVVELFVAADGHAQ